MLTRYEEKQKKQKTNKQMVYCYGPDKRGQTMIDNDDDRRAAVFAKNKPDKFHYRFQ